MARTFASGDKIRCSAGLAAPWNGAVMMAAICKTDASRDGQWRNMLSVLNSGGTWSTGYAMELSNFSGNTVAFSNSNAATTAFSTTSTVAADGWCLHVVTKATGSATPRYHRYKFSTGVWVHEAMSAAVSNSAGSAGGFVEIGGDLGGAGDTFVGDIAIAGMQGAAPGDQDVEALAYTLQAWIGLATKGLWPLDQSATTQKVVDLSGGGANESSLTGTSVASASVPVFNYFDGPWVPTIVAPAAGGGTDLTLTPGVGTATATGSTPAVLVTGAPAAGTATATGSTPGELLTLTPGAGTATATGSTPILTATGSLTLTPGAGTATASGTTPGMLVTEAPGAGTATATGSTPVPALLLAPGAGTATATGSTPSLILSGEVTLTPGAGTAVASGSTPAVVITPDFVPPPPDVGGGIPFISDDEDFTTVEVTNLALRPGVAVAVASGSRPRVVIELDPLRFRLPKPLRRAPAVPKAESLTLTPKAGSAAATGSTAVVRATSLPSVPEMQAELERRDKRLAALEARLTALEADREEETAILAALSAR